ncbi:MAG: selenocysteine-specific translation elongation factor [Promethearchaeota archaeon]
MVAEEKLTNEQLEPVHIGLLGHIDAGKTAIARCLTQVVSTSGLDKHPQSQDRGITIDLGFTFFPLDKYMITLVDAPGHADLIRSVVSCANIIDIGLLIIDAKEGPQVQTGEHLVILDLMEIPELIVVINKVDLVSESHISQVELTIRKILKGTRFENTYHLVKVSAKNIIGITELKQETLDVIHGLPINRDFLAPLNYLFDHHFAKKGQGTVVTGTVLSGHATIGDNVTILPLLKSTKIKSIQKWKTSAQKMKAGDRCGISISNVNVNSLYRGCIITNSPESFQNGQWLQIRVKKYRLFMHSCPFGQEFTLSHGMRSLNARIFPYYEKTLKNSNDLQKIWLSPPLEQDEFDTIIWIEKPEYFQMNDKILLTRLDLSPKTLRIFGSGRVLKILVPPISLNKIKVKHGIVRNPKYSTNTVIVENLTQSFKGGQSLLNKFAEPPFSKIVSTFGQKGNLEIKLDPNRDPAEKISTGMKVEVKLVKEFVIDPKRSYEFLKK